MFKKLIMASVIALSSLAASSATVNFDVGDLSPSQISELKAQAARAVADSAKGNSPPAVDAPAITLTNAASWGQQASLAAEGFAKALGIAARELGVTVNDFLHTDAGKITALLIIWKVAGAAIMKALYGMIFMTVGLSVIRVIYIRLFTHEYVSKEYSWFFGGFKGTRMVRVVKNFAQLEAPGEWFAFIILLVMCILVLGIGSIFFM